ncbi:MAG: hypothetical protein ACRDL5_01805 [Solirubrobacteraceae bacterium]
MSLRLILGLLAALISASMVNIAYLREQLAVSGMSELSLRHLGRSVRHLLASRAWLIGFAMESVGFGLYVLALGLAPLALVQSVSAGGLGILAVAGARLAHRRLHRQEIIGALIAIGGLALLALSLSSGSARDARGSAVVVVLWLAGTAGLAVLVLSSSRIVFRSAVADGIAGGLFFSIGDICTKLVTAGGTRLWFAIPLVAGYLLGTMLLQLGYQSGTALTVAGLSTLFTNAVPIAAGTLVLGEQVPVGALGILRLLAFAAVTVGAILLVRPQQKGGALQQR